MSWVQFVCSYISINCTSYTCIGKLVLGIQCKFFLTYVCVNRLDFLRKPRVLKMQVGRLFKVLNPTIGFLVLFFSFFLYETLKWSLAKRAIWGWDQVNFQLMYLIGLENWKGVIGFRLLVSFSICFMFYVVMYLTLTVQLYSNK